MLGMKIRGFRVQGALILARNSKATKLSHTTMRISDGQNGETTMLGVLWQSIGEKSS